MKDLKILSVPDKQNAEDLIRKLELLEKEVIKQRNNDPKTKYTTVAFFHDISKHLKYRVPTPPIDIQENRHVFRCPSCGTLFEAENDFPEDFNVCYVCGQVWKEINLDE